MVYYKLSQETYKLVPQEVFKSVNSRITDIIVTDNVACVVCETPFFLVETKGAIKSLLLGAHNQKVKALVKVYM